MHVCITGRSSLVPISIGLLSPADTDSWSYQLVSILSSDVFLTQMSVCGVLYTYQHYISYCMYVCTYVHDTCVWNLLSRYVCLCVPELCLTEELCLVSELVDVRMNIICGVHKLYTE